MCLQIFKEGLFLNSMFSVLVIRSEILSLITPEPYATIPTVLQYACGNKGGAQTDTNNKSIMRVVTGCVQLRERQSQREEERKNENRVG